MTTAMLAALAFFGFAILVGAVGSLMVERVLDRVANLAPASRARRLAAFAVAPIVAAGLLTLACLLPAAANVVGIGADHCLRHDDGHGHLCFVHQPVLRAPAAWLVMAALAVALWRVARRVVALVSTLALVRGLRRAARYDAARDLHLVAHGIAFAFASGREIFVSRALVAQLSRAELAIVVAHERAHARRRDGLVRAFVEALSFAWWPLARRRVLDAHALACEEACDEAAAERYGDRVEVAAAILAVERLMSAPPSFAPAFVGSNVPARVESLLNPRAIGPKRSLVVPALVIAVGVLVAADPIHHLTETLLGVFTR